MDTGTILNRFKQCFNEIPEKDSRAKIGPREFVVALIFSLSKTDRGKRSLETLRRSLKKATGINLSRGSFWERLATNRLFSFLLLLAQESIQQMGNFAFGGVEMKVILSALKVKGIFVLDSSSITLPDMAGAVFPGSRKNVAPSVIKWHSCFDLFGGTIKWFDLSPGTSHDHNHIPDLRAIVGYLIVFDLGYFDFCLFQAIDNVGGYFLSRIKTNTVIQVDKVIQGLPKKFEGQWLFSKKLPKQRSIIEVMGLFKDGLFQFRVIGFWNPIDNCYHWYVTNLTVAAKLIYPLYRLRWQVELHFKMAKSSLNLSDISSAHPNIVQSLILASIVVTTLTQPLAFTLALLHQKDNNHDQLPSFQRAGIVISQVSNELRNFLISKKSVAQDILFEKLKLFSEDLFDPNKNRETSMQRALREAQLIT